MKRTCLAVPVCHSERRAAVILNAAGTAVRAVALPRAGRDRSRRGDVSVAAGGGSSRVRAARVAGGVTRCAAHAGRRRAAARQAGAAGLVGSG